MKFRNIKKIKCGEMGKLLLLAVLFYFATFVSGIMFLNNIFISIFILTVVAITLIISYLFILYLYYKRLYKV